MSEPVPAVPDPASTEPLLTVGTITALATAILGLLVLFGVDIPDEGKAAILSAVGVLAPVVVAVWGRRKVYAPATVARLLSAGRR